jgi:hypothetical protein
MKIFKSKIKKNLFLLKIKSRKTKLKQSPFPNKIFKNYLTNSKTKQQE